MSHAVPASLSAAPRPESEGWWTKTDNAWLHGNLAPIADERDTAELEIIGEVPKCLRGMYLRNGPNQQFEPPGSYHLFDGDGMVHAVQFDRGRVRYRNKWVKTRALTYERSLGRGIYAGLASFHFPDPEHVLAGGATKNVANISVLSHAGRLFALSESGPPIEFDKRLDTLGTARFDGVKLPYFTAHPRKVPDTDQLVAFAYSAFYPFLRYYLLDSTGEVLTNDIVDIPDPVMIHDIVLAGDYAILLDAPATFDFASGLRGGPLLKWRPERGARFGVLPIQGRAWDIRWFEVEPCYVFHYLNGHQAGDKLVFEGIRLPELLDNVAAGTSGIAPEFPLARFTIDLARGGPVKVERLSERGMEFPIVDPRVIGRAQRYGYTVGYRAENKLEEYDRVNRIDFQRGITETYEYGAGRATGEVMYVAHPDSAREEDGFLMSFVYDARENTSELVILNAGDLQAGPVARIRLPRRVPVGFHGTWAPAWDL